MKNECSNIHLPNYKTACCLRHLVEMAKYAEMQTLIKKYSKFLLVTLNHNSKTDKLKYSTIKLDLLLAFTDVITKYMSHFFIINKPDYAKVLGCIAIKAFKETAFKEHPEVILRKISIHNNISCIYEAKGNYSNAYNYLSKNRQFIALSSNLDNAILYNNLLRYCFKLNKKEEILELIIQLKDALNEELKNAKVYSMKSAKDISLSSSVLSNTLIQKESYEKNQLISFLLSNLNSISEKLGRKAEARELLKKGYEFSMSVLGEYHFYTQSFVNKINIHKGMYYRDDTDSNENDYNGNSNINGNSNSTGERKQFYKKTNKSFDSVIRFQFEQRQKESMINDEYKKKVDYLYDYVMSQKRSPKTFPGDPKNSQSETEPSLTNVGRIDHRAYNQFTTSIKPLVSNTALTMTIKPQIPVKKTKKDLIEEFYQDSKEKGEYKKKKSQKLSESSIDNEYRKQSVEINNNSKREEPKPIETDKSTVNQTSNGTGTAPTKQLKIKAMFSKVLGSTKPAKQEGKLQQLINQLNNDNDDDNNRMKNRKSLSNNNISINFNKNKDNDNEKDKEQLAVTQKIDNSILISERNIIKTELETIMKQIAIKINLDKEDDHFEFKPFYQTNKNVSPSYKKRDYSVNQKVTKFIKRSNHEPDTGDSFLDNLKKANNMNPSLKEDTNNTTTVIQQALPSFNYTLEKEEPPFEFIPFYTKNNKKLVKKETEVLQKSVKFIRQKNKQEVSMTDFLNQAKQNESKGNQPDSNTNTNTNSSNNQIEAITMPIKINYSNKESEFEFKPYYWKNPNFQGDNRVIEVHQKKAIKIVGAKTDEINNDANDKNNDDEFPEMIVAYDKEEREYEFFPFYSEIENETDKRHSKEDESENNTLKKKKLVFYVNKDLLNGKALDNNEFLPKICMKLSKDEEVYEFKPFYSKNSNIHREANESTQIKPRQIKIVYTLNEDDIDNNHNNNNNSHSHIKSSSSSLDIDISTQFSPKAYDNLLIDTDSLISNEAQVPLTNYFESKTKCTIDTSEYFNHLIQNSLASSQFCVSTLSLYKGQFYKITITQSDGLSSILFKLYNPLNPKETLSELSTNSLKLKTILQKIYLFNVLPRSIGLNHLSSFEDLIKNIIIYHCNIIQEGSKYCIGISPKPNSLYGDRQIQYKFLKANCIIELMVIQKNQLRLMITNKENRESSFCIDCLCDESSFKLLVTELPNQSPMLKDEYYIPAYKFNDKQMTKNGFVLVLIKRTQEIIAFKTNNSNSHEKELTFESIQKDIHSYFFQCTVKSNCTQVSFNDLSYESCNDHYTLNKYMLPLERDKEMTRETYTIDIKNINHLFNCNNDINEYSQLYKKQNERERVISHDLIINTYNQTATTLFNYLTIIDIESNALMSLQLLSYPNDYFFVKVLFYQPITNYEYSLFFMPQKGVNSNCYVKTLESQRKSLRIILCKIYKEHILAENIQMIKYYPMSFLTNNKSS